MFIDNAFVYQYLVLVLVLLMAHHEFEINYCYLLVTRTSWHFIFLRQTAKSSLFKWKTVTYHEIHASN